MINEDDKNNLLTDLKNEHSSLKKRLIKLEKKVHLSEDEILEARRIKKLKLAAKDKMLMLEV